MITAMQKAKLVACISLGDARDKVLETRSIICWNDVEVHVIDEVLTQLDVLLNKVLP